MTSEEEENKPRNRPENLVYCPDYKLGRYFEDMNQNSEEESKEMAGIMDEKVELEAIKSNDNVSTDIEAVLRKDFLKRICEPPNDSVVARRPSQNPKNDVPFIPRIFYKLGYKIGEAPSNFIIIPLLISLLFGTGIQRLRYEADPEYLFTPTNGGAISERKIIEDLFPMNYTHKFNPSRITKGGRFARILIQAQDGGTLLREKVFKEIIALDNVMHNISIEWDEDLYRYKDLCAGWGGEDCYENPVLELNDSIAEIESGNITMLYPLFLTNTFKSLQLPFIFGGLKLSNLSQVEFVTVMQLNYFLAVNTHKQERRGEVWEQKVLDTLEEMDLKWKHIKVQRYTILTQGQELTKTTTSIIPYFTLTVTLMVIFMVITCMMMDWVKSKPWLGIAGVVSTNLGCLAAFGIVCYFGVEFIGVNIAVPFLMLGIGVDDSFVFLSAWRRTSPHDSVPKRMAQTYSEAAVSITITSVTDALSFLVGIFTPFRIVQVFSLYAGIAVVATYIWHITFFGAFMAISGYHEKDNRHSVLWWMPTTPRSKTGGKSFWYRAFFTGGINLSDPFNPKDNPDHGGMVFFRDYWAFYLNKSWVKVSVLLLFVAYLATSFWGISNIREGLEKQKLSLYDSYATKFFDTEDKYFKEFPYRIQVVVSGEMDYSSPIVQNKIENLMKELQESPFCTHKYSESWLRAFLGYVKRSEDLYGHNIKTEEQFIKVLLEEYIDSSSIYYEDIKFNANKTRIIAARFIIQTVDILNSNVAKDMTEQLRRIAQNQDGLNVTVYNPLFGFFDQYLLIRRTTLQCLSIAAVMMLIVCLIFIPSPICSLWVAFSIVSIEIGVVGFMTLWGVNLDAISMVNLIMCVGFSVDFSAHISYAYITSKGDTPQEKLEQSLYALGLPIVLGAISTVLGMFSAVIAPSYIFITFFKVIFLVIFIATMHGLLLLPVLLSIFGPKTHVRNTRL